MNPKQVRAHYHFLAEVQEAFEKCAPCLNKYPYQWELEEEDLGMGRGGQKVVITISKGRQLLGKLSLQKSKQGEKYYLRFRDGYHRSEISLDSVAYQILAKDEMYARRDMEAKKFQLDRARREANLAEKEYQETKKRLDSWTGSSS